MEAFGAERSQKGKDIGVEEGSGMKGSSRRTTSENSDVAEADRGGSCLRDNKCGAGSEMDSGNMDFMGKVFLVSGTRVFIQMRVKF